MSDGDAVPRPSKPLEKGLSETLTVVGESMSFDKGEIVIDSVINQSQSSANRQRPWDCGECMNYSSAVAVVTVSASAYSSGIVRLSSAMTSVFITGVLLLITSTGVSAAF